MKRIKVDIPDDIYGKSIKIVQERGITFDEFCAKGIEILAEEWMREDEDSSRDKTTDQWKVEWKKIRKRLNGKTDKYELSDETKNDWEEAIKIFSERLNKFYIKHINELTELPEKYGGQGFIIVTAQCVLKETFAAFKRGKIFDREKYDLEKKDSSIKEEDQIYYKESRHLFVDFLNTEPLFEGIFHNSIAENCPHSAKQFYSNVRCGLMHEARTKGKYIIHRSEEDYKRNNPTHKKTGKFIKENGQQKKIIFRNELQETLEDYFGKYKRALKEPDNKTLRRLFARKLDHLFDLTEEEKKGYEWWQQRGKQKTFCNIISWLKNFVFRKKWALR